MRGFWGTYWRMVAEGMGDLLKFMGFFLCLVTALGPPIVGLAYLGHQNPWHYAWTLPAFVLYLFLLMALYEYRRGYRR